MRDGASQEFRAVCGEPAASHVQVAVGSAKKAHRLGRWAHESLQGKAILLAPHRTHPARC